MECVAEHIMIQTMAGMDTGFGRTARMEKRVFIVVLPVYLEEIGSLCSKGFCKSMPSAYR
jgi:hypothetical protein